MSRCFVRSWNTGFDSYLSAFILLISGSEKEKEIKLCAEIKQLLKEASSTNYSFDSSLREAFKARIEAILSVNCTNNTVRNKS
ncbi:hypothetical protein QL285_008076 [Trifolium repens]|nr:hypothetical protein QL285_008076 [Trifolium repens]